ncbi:hypothetical protein BDV40DRAFT_304576, partial [Aspergillus tamarii]
PTTPGETPVAPTGVSPVQPTTPGETPVAPTGVSPAQPSQPPLTGAARAVKPTVGLLAAVMGVMILL